MHNVLWTDSVLFRRDRSAAGVCLNFLVRVIQIQSYRSTWYLSAICRSIVRTCCCIWGVGRCRCVFLALSLAGLRHRCFQDEEGLVHLQHWRLITAILLAAPGTTVVPCLLHLSPRCRRTWSSGCSVLFVVFQFLRLRCKYAPYSPYLFSSSKSM